MIESHARACSRLHPPKTDEAKSSFARILSGEHLNINIWRYDVLRVSSSIGCFAERKGNAARERTNSPQSGVRATDVSGMG
jgi:hypothetical protein